MVIVGGITRLTHSGLSIVKWDLVYGILPPLSQGQWEAAFQDYQESPEFKKVNSNFELADYQSIFWWEYIHRLIGRMMGFIFVIPLIWFLAKKRFTRVQVFKVGGILLLGGLQGYLGWYMVKSGLVNNPAVSHFRLASHLLMAFLTFGYIFWLALDFSSPNTKKPPANLRVLRQIGWGILALLVFQIAWGAFVAGLKAGFFYNTWPKMGADWIPDLIFSSIQEFGIASTWTDPPVVQFIHRGLGVLLIGASTALWLVSRKLKLSKNQRNSIYIFLASISTQFTLGVFTILYSVPISLGVLHQIGALFVFGSLLLVLHRAKQGE